MTAVFRMVLSKLRSRRLQTGIILGGSFLLSFFAAGILLLCFALEPSFDASYLELKVPSLPFLYRSMVFPVWMGGLARSLGLLKLPVYLDAPMVAAAVFMILAVGFLAAAGP